MSATQLSSDRNHFIVADCVLFSASPTSVPADYCHSPDPSSPAVAQVLDLVRSRRLGVATPGRMGIAFNDGRRSKTLGHLAGKIDVDFAQY